MVGPLIVAEGAEEWRHPGLSPDGGTVLYANIHILGLNPHNSASCHIWQAAHFKDNEVSLASGI